MIPIKTPEQIEFMRRSGQLAREILDKVSSKAAPGVTTGEIDDYCAELIKEAGAISAFLGYRGFPGHLCVSVNEEVVHGIGGKKKLAYGDVVKLDVGVFLDGWVGDNATTVAVGAISPEVERLLQITEESLYRGIDFARPGRKLGDVCSAIQKHVEKNGYTIVREFVGHGVGRSLHEEPQVPNYGKRGSGPKLKPGMTLAIEPMVNMGRSSVKILSDGWTVITSDKKPSAHYEHSVLVTDSDPEILTVSQEELSRKVKT
ncbi:MAG: type I methionyl aminopeptidase [Verrucomicrobiota bacterium]